MLGLTRRQLLALGGGLSTAGLLGCTGPSPVVRGGPTRAPSAPAAPPVPGAAAGVGLETRCAELAERLRTGSEDADARRWALVGAVHAEHARVLAHPDPTAPSPRDASPRPPAPTPAPGGSPTSSVGGQPPVAEVGVAELPRAYRDAVGAALTAHREQAGASRGTLALLWASLATFDAAVPDADPVAADTDLALPTPWQQVDEPTAQAELLIGLHAAIAGYELALVPLDPAGADWPPARRRLTQLLRLRDDLTLRLTDVGAEAPTAEPDYGVASDPTDDRGSVRLRRELELALQPLVGRWVQAAVDPTDATSTLIRSVLAGTGIGAGLRPWPGW